MTETPQDDERRSDDAPRRADEQARAPQPFGTPGHHEAPRHEQPPYGPPGQYGAPGQYAQPGQFGQYDVPGQYELPQAPTRKSRVGVLVGAAALILALIAIGVVLAMHLGPTVLDRAAVERDVAAQFEQLEGVAVDLSCPQEMKVESGAEYRCTGTTADGEEVEIAIRIGDERNGDYTWTEV
jgi:hypothetical protein